MRAVRLSQQRGRVQGYKSRGVYDVWHIVLMAVRFFFVFGSATRETGVSAKGEREISAS